jgi:hypothetical protein
MILMFVVVGLAESYLVSSARGASCTAFIRLPLNMPDPGFYPPRSSTRELGRVADRREQ